MNTARLLPFLLSIILLVSAISSVKAHVWREDEKYIYNPSGGLLFSYRVHIVVEAEEDGVWFVGKSYRVNFTVALNRLNLNMFPSYRVSIVFHSPSGVATENTKVLANSTTLSVGVGLGHISLLASETRETKLTLYPSMAYETYVDSKRFEGGYWESDEPIYIDVKSAPPFPSPLVLIAIGIALGASVVGAFFVFKTRKRPK